MPEVRAAPEAPAENRREQALPVIPVRHRLRNRVLIILRRRIIRHRRLRRRAEILRRLRRPRIITIRSILTFISDFPETTKFVQKEVP